MSVILLWNKLVLDGKCCGKVFKKNEISEDMRFG